MKLAVLAIIACLCMSAMALATNNRGGSESSTYRDEIRAALYHSLHESKMRLTQLKFKLVVAIWTKSDKQPYLQQIQIEKARIVLLKSYLWSFDTLSDAELWDIVVEQGYCMASPSGATRQQCAGHV